MFEKKNPQKSYMISFREKESREEFSNGWLVWSKRIGQFLLKKSVNDIMLKGYGLMSQNEYI